MSGGGLRETLRLWAWYSLTTEMLMPSADQVADAIRAYCHARDIPVTTLGLQKLLYFAQAWHLAFNDEPFFDGEFEAWASGPVHRPTYDRFRHLGHYAVVPPPADAPALDGDATQHLDEVMRTYAHLEYFDLDSIVRDAAYRSVRPDPVAPGPPPTIRPEAMRDHYASLLPPDDDAGAMAGAAA